MIKLQGFPALISLFFFFSVSNAHPLCELVHDNMAFDNSPAQKQETLFTYTLPYESQLCISCISHEGFS